MSYGVYREFDNLSVPQIIMSIHFIDEIMVIVKIQSESDFTLFNRQKIVCDRFVDPRRHLTLRIEIKDFIIHRKSRSQSSIMVFVNSPFSMKYYGDNIRPMSHIMKKNFEVSSSKSALCMYSEALPCLSELFTKTNKQNSKKLSRKEEVKAIHSSLTQQVNAHSGFSLSILVRSGDQQEATTLIS